MRSFRVLRSIFSDFQEGRKKEPTIIDESAGPFQCVYLSIFHVIGAKLPDNSPDPLHIVEFPDTNGTAFLTHDWETQYTHVDRGSAMGALLLTGLVGIKRFQKSSRILDKFLRWSIGSERAFLISLNAQTKRIRDQRVKVHSGSGCCLVYRAVCPVTLPLNLSASRKFSNVGVALNALDGRKIREAHNLNVRNVATSVSIALTDTNGTPEIRYLTDDIHLLGKNGLIVYARKTEVGAGAVVLTTVPSEEFSSDVQNYANGLRADKKLSASASLFTLSQQKSNDNLRSFIASWSALESLIFNLEKRYRTDFRKLLESRKIDLPPWDIDLGDIEIKDYRLRDRFYAVCCSINLNEAEGDLEKFKNMNSKRNAYYHRFEVKDTELPTEEVQAIFRKYLKLVLSVQRNV